MAEPNNPEFQMFKGLQRPLEFLGLQGRYIVWAAITAGISLLGFIITYTLLGFMVGLIVLVIAVSTGVGIIMIKQRKGLYSKKNPKGVFIYAYSERLSHVTLHQTIIGLEAEKQMEMAGEYPDIVIGCFGGGSNFGGISFPFMRHNILEGKKTRFVAAEPASCPKLTRGKFQYDFGDEAGYTPLLPMFTLGHNFAPAHIHAGGLRYHGAGVIVSQLLKDKLMEAVDIQQLESFEAGCLFAQAEGIIPAPESCHAIAAAIREANQCKETGEEKVILFNLSGHGLIDMASYDKYLAGDLVNYSLTDEDIQKNLDEIGNLEK